MASAASPCHIAGLRTEVLCGSVSRPLDAARPDGLKIDVKYVVVPALARNKLPDPVFLIAGGPGQSAIEVAPATLPLFTRLNNRRDIVFVDQRGTGRSAPLQCDDPRHESLADADTDHQVARLAECRDKLAKLAWVGSVDGLRFFTTTIAMDDLDAVRRQLGAERIDLVGASYGTRAALEYLRLHPANVRRVVIDGVAPPDMALPASFSTDGQAALEQLFVACEREAACHRQWPRLREDWQALLRGLPKRVSAAQPLTGRIESFTLTRAMVLNAVRGPLYGPSLAAALPAALHDAAQGRYEPLLGLASLLSSHRGMTLATGMHFSVVCSEDMPRLALNHDKPGADFGDDQARLYTRVCADWPRGEVPAAFYSIPKSPAPVLLTSGSADPATPPRHAARAAAALGANARQVVVPNAGHGVLSIGCMRDVMFRFIDAEADAEALKVDAGCVAHVPRPPAWLPLDGPP